MRGAVHSSFPEKNSITLLPWAIWQKDRRSLPQRLPLEEKHSRFLSNTMAVFLSHWGIPWSLLPSTPSGNTWLTKAYSLQSDLSGRLFAVNSQCCSFLLFWISVQCGSNYVISLHNSQRESTCAWKGSYFHEVVFSGKNRDKWLYDTAAVTLDIEEATGNDWARDRRKERELSGSMQGADFNRQHHRNIK